jgi:hypothetical protein
MRTATRILNLACCAAVIAGGSISAAEDDKPNMQPGNWEITISMEMEGMPVNLSKKPLTSSHCIKPEDVKDFHTIAENNQPRDKKCKVGDLKRDGDKVTYSFTCEGGASGTSEVIYKGTTYEGTTVMNVGAGPQGAMRMTQRFKGKRLGDC